jgi:hypothetical protein
MDGIVHPVSSKSLALNLQTQKFLSPSFVIVI